MDAIYYAMNPWWEGKTPETGIPREDYTSKLKKGLKRRQIEVLVGSRRVGKTTLLKQLIENQINEGARPDSILYLPLDHPQLSGKTILEHLKEFRKNFMHDRSKELTLYLDEVQESPGWETQLKAIYDTEKIKTICTGSTASLLKSQGGKLTGRQIVTTIYPLSFKEYLLFRGKKPLSSEDYKYENLVEQYLEDGGYPENVLHPSGEYMQNLLEDIIARDLIKLYNLKKPWIVKDLLKLIAASVGSRTSYNKLANTLKTTVDTVKEYTSYLESAFLVKSMEKYSTSHTERIYSQKKIYLMDTGVKTLLTGAGDTGAKAENAVYIKLLTHKTTCGYYAESEREVDFICPHNNTEIPMEVKYSSEIDWKDKKYSGIRLYLQRNPKTRKIQIISKDVQEKIKEKNLEINITPLWKFLLNNHLRQV